MPTSIKLLHVSAPGVILWESKNTITQVEHISVRITLHVLECFICQNSKLYKNPIIFSDFRTFLHVL